MRFDLNQGSAVDLAQTAILAQVLESVRRAIRLLVNCHTTTPWLDLDQSRAGPERQLSGFTIELEQPGGGASGTIRGFSRIARPGRYQ
jgi:hypothetical protein